MDYENVSGVVLCYNLYFVSLFVKRKVCCIKFVGCLKLISNILECGVIRKILYFRLFEIE